MDDCTEVVCQQIPLLVYDVPPDTVPGVVVPVTPPADGLADTGLVSGEILLPGLLLIAVGVAMLRLRRLA